MLDPRRRQFITLLVGAAAAWPLAVPLIRVLSGRSGQALSQEKFDSEALARIKANTTAQDWAALYQQEPDLVSATSRCE